MNDNRLAMFISFLFAEDRKKFIIAPNKVKRILADLWKSPEKLYEKHKETKNE